MRCMLYLLGRFLPKLGPCLHGPFLLRPGPFAQGDALSDDAIEIIDRQTVHQGFFRVDRYRLRHRVFAGGWSAELSREVLERGGWRAARSLRILG